MQLYLIRHLPTEWNLQGKLQGSADIDILSPDKEARYDIAKNMEVIRSVRFDCVLTSEYKRTVSTAQEYGFEKAHAEPLLNELSFGKYEGRLKSEMLDSEAAWTTDVKKCTRLAEEIELLEYRLRQFIAVYGDRKSVLAFSHGAVIRALMALARMGQINRMNSFEVGNNELVILEF